MSQMLSHGLRILTVRNTTIQPVCWPVPWAQHANLKLQLEEIPRMIPGLINGLDRGAIECCPVTPASGKPLSAKSR
jgi:hypothetical protein